ncbi:related to esterase [Rhynchosporium secalis]|uniref:Carboxylic ester hydrolase n=1 Tax=Rhynchosporium secalis TaxID=38038 RepID=A0A1E1MML6_RHYSE|nr:related to esterase [Rhynchosporium secalis]
MKLSIVIVLATATLVALYSPRPRQSTNLQVDLGYSIYEGFYNELSGVNEWQGIRFAAPPIGNLRWQAPQPPIFNRSTIIQASGIPDQCPQSPANVGTGSYITENNGPSVSEDCLFLDVFAPVGDIQNLPVLVWIHGGGYGLGNGRQDLAPAIRANGDSFIGVSIQYRLGAFGFLSSDEVNRFGVPNAGLRDQTFALQWVQSYIHLFGGNASRVTIMGVSAGAGSVMLQAMAYGGTMGTSLFTNAIAASPYLPMQYNYNDWIPSQSYYAFAAAAGCLSGSAYGSPAGVKSPFKCLVEKDTATLQNASASISASGTWGSLGFLPVTDGKFIQQRPSAQLQKKQVNGLRVMSGNVALEAAGFVPQNITTEDALISWMRVVFPLFTNDDISKVLRYYPNIDASDSTSAVGYATSGYTGATAINVSSIATGHQQRANNIYAETTFVCPSYWLTEAYTSNGREGWKYQYSVPPAIHGMDLSGYFGPGSPQQGPDFIKAFMTIFVNFITINNPSIPSSIASGNSSSGSSPTPSSSEDTDSMFNWPAYTSGQPLMLNLNETGGEEYTAVGITFNGTPISVTQARNPGLKNNFTLVDAHSWEGGRGVRCDFWRSVGESVPE